MVEKCFKWSVCLKCPIYNNPKKPTPKAIEVTAEAAFLGRVLDL
jgi:hypothetical protein